MDITVKTPLCGHPSNQSTSLIRETIEIQNIQLNTRKISMRTNSLNILIIKYSWNTLIT